MARPAQLWHRAPTGGCWCLTRWLTAPHDSAMEFYVFVTPLTEILSSSKPQGIRSRKRKPTGEELPVSLSHSHGRELWLWSGPCSSWAMLPRNQALAPERAQTLHASIFTPIFPCLQSNRVIINSVADPWYLGISSILSLFSFHSEREACQNSNIFFLFFIVNTIVQNCPIEHRTNIISKRKKKIKAQSFDLFVGDEKGNGKTPIGFLKENQQKLLNI